MNATAAIFQRREAAQFQASELLSKHLAKSLLKNRMWLIGITVQIGAFFAQAAALHYGVLTTVEPLMTCDLLFILAILFFYFHVPLGRREWGGALAMVIGLSSLLLAASPRAGSLAINPLGLLLMVVIIGVVMALAALYGKAMKTPAARALMLGLATGIGFALTAALTKLFVQGFRQFGVGLLMHYQPYALLLAGLVSLFLAQSAYSAGPLTASQPAMMIADPLVSVVIGVSLFGDIINHSVLALVEFGFSGLILAAGVWLLSGSPTINQVDQPPAPRLSPQLKTSPKKC